VQTWGDNRTGRQRVRRPLLRAPTPSSRAGQSVWRRARSKALASRVGLVGTMTPRSASWQWGQVFSQNTTAVGLPVLDARSSVPLPVRLASITCALARVAVSAGPPG